MKGKKKACEVCLHLGKGRRRHVESKEADLRRQAGSVQCSGKDIWEEDN